MNRIRHQTSSADQYPSHGSFRSGYPTKPWSRAKKYLVVGGGILALIMAGLFVLAFKIALILAGVIVAVVAITGAYTYFHRKFG